ncbi:hypothetical protein [Streptomyces sp. NPDC048106]|uniref:hypothetical protein n=1 Tax=Streptomyces sp. NPDC048106 TaxID=3155750 RepID=UPI00345556F8
MKIGRSAVLLAVAVGTVVFGAGGAEADSPHGKKGGEQVNNCTVVSLVNILGGPQLDCVNMQTSGRGHGDAKQVNNCQVFVLATVGNLQVLPLRLDESSTTCRNVRH